MAITRLSGGTTPANGSDPRTFPAIWNDAADDIEAAESAISVIEANDWVTTARIDDDAVTTAKIDDDAVTTAKILDGNVTAAKLNADVKLGKILQVVQTVKTDTFTTTSSSLVDITGFSVTITPSSATSKILVSATMGMGSNSSAAPDFLLLRDSTGIFLGDAAGSRLRVTGRAFGSASNTSMAPSLQFLDSPATTSAVTYKVQMRSNSGSTVSFNRNIDDGDSTAEHRAASSITVMEVAG